MHNTSSMKLDEDTLSILSMLDFPTPTTTKIVEQLPRPKYAKINKALEAMGAKWSRKEKAHVFAEDARARVDLAITTGMVETAGDVGWFASPPPVAKELVRLANVGRGMLCLEPSAGEGAIVRELLAAGAHVTAVERNTGRRDKLRAMALDKQQAQQISISIIDDFMDAELPKNGGRFVGPHGFDRVVMNPPFCKVGKGDHLDHFWHAFDMLAVGGTIVSVMPSSVVFRRDRRYADFRDRVCAKGKITPLPALSFKVSGTDVNTVIARMVKP